MVVTTCRAPGNVRRCLRSVLTGDRPPDDLIVVENRPEGSAVAAMLADEFAGGPEVRYVEEPAKGLSNAGNAGLRHASAEVVALTDDDVLADRNCWPACAPSWLTRTRTARPA